MDEKPKKAERTEWELIDALAKCHILLNAGESAEDFRRALDRWWCIRYNRPFKDPLLQAYTAHELFYEFRFVYYMQNDPKSEEAQKKQVNDAWEWARRVAEEERQRNLAKQQKPNEDPKPPESQETEAPPPDVPSLSFKSDPEP